MDGIGASTARQLNLKGITTPEQFYAERYEDIIKMGDKEITRAWIRARMLQNQAQGVPLLQATVARCENDLNKQHSLSVGELGKPISAISRGLLPASCDNEDAITILNSMQHFDEWQEYIACQQEEAQQIQLATKANVVGRVPEHRMLIGTANNYYAKIGSVQDQTGFEFLFPGTSLNRTFIHSEQMASLLQALSNGKDVPAAPLLMAISDQLDRYASEFNMPFLSFLAHDYAKYPNQPFNVTHLTPGVSNSHDMKDSYFYFITHSVFPVSNKLVTYVQQVDASIWIAQASSFAMLMKQLVFQERSDQNIVLDAIALKVDTPGERQVLFTKLAEILITEAELTKNTNVFETLLMYAEKLPLNPSKYELKMDRKLTKQTFQVLTNERVPLKVWTDAFLLNVTEFTIEDEAPYWALVRQSILDENDIEAILTTLSPERQAEVFKLNDPPTQADYMWAVETVVLSRRNITELFPEPFFTNAPDPVKALLGRFRPVPAAVIP